MVAYQSVASKIPCPHRCASQWSARLTWRTVHCAIVVAVTCGMAACGATGDLPTSPSDRDILGLDVSCPSSLLIGEKAPCIAVARFPSGDTALVSPNSTWSSTRPDIVTVDIIGNIDGRSPGQALVSASYGGRRGSTSVMVTAQDALRVQAAADQGDFRRGSTVTMQLQGYYSVASEETGELSLEITDQEGLIVRTSPMAVVKGGDFFLLSSTFTIPQRSSQLCRTAVLKVGPVTVSEPTSNASGLWCLSVRP